MDHANRPPESPASLALPLSGLSVHQSVLVRRKPGSGIVVARHSISSIESMELFSKIHFFPIFLCILSSFLLGVSQYYIDSTLELWGGRIFLSLVLFFSFLSVREHYLKLSFSEGIVCYKLEDPLDECQGFFVSLRSLSRELD